MIAMNKLAHLVEESSRLQHGGIGIALDWNGWIERARQALLAIFTTSDVAEEFVDRIRAADASQSLSVGASFLNGLLGVIEIYSQDSGAPAPITQDAAANPLPNRGAVSKKKVFVVHGQDDLMKSEVAHFLSFIGLEPIILHEQVSAGKTVAEKLEKYSDVGFTVVLMSPDDIGAPAKSKFKQAFHLPKRARQNVILELGYFWGVLGRHYICALVKGDLEKPSDILGIVYVPFEGNLKCDLLRELREAKMEFDPTKVG
ncbi:MAG: nucleotide-binding protein [Planctomycetes bacterium]|nr:nucleotide-binding protein [Planctomycetota bacterium]